MTDIRFGTDGWRAIVGEDYTLQNVYRVARATASWIHDTYGGGSSVAIGRDPRNYGREAAEATARVMAEGGLRVFFAKNITPTPALSWATKEYECSAGVVITASHNPAEYNGFKIKGYFGGSALPEMVTEIERRVSQDSFDDADLKPLEEYISAGTVKLCDIRADYIEHLRSKIDVELIRSAGVSVVHDAMYGAGQGIFSELLGSDAVDELHSEIDVEFGGTPPEPIERNLLELPEAVRSNGRSAGIANDGDADRIGMCDENGRFVDSHRLLALLVQYLHEDKGMGGDVVKTFSTTDMLDVMGKAYGLTVHTTPIGFKFIGKYFLDGDVLVGGEESGGIAVKGHIPERDGIYIGALMLEMMAARKKPLSHLVDQLFRQFGPHAYHRIDKHTSETAKEQALMRLKDDGGLKSISGDEVKSLETLDGYKHKMENGWLLIRPSGTEPVLRIYSEAGSRAQAEAYVNDAIEQLGL